MNVTELARRPKVRRRVAIAAAVVAAYGVIGFFAVPPLLRSLLAGKLTHALHRRTTVEGVSFNPFALSVRVRGVTVREPASEAVFVSLGQLYANVKLSSLIHFAPVLKELRLADLHVHLVRHADSTYNFSDLIAPAPPPAVPGKPLRYALNNIQLTGGSIEFDDRPVGKVNTVRNLYLGIPFLSNLPDETEVFVQPALRAVVNGTPVALTGRSKPFASSRETLLDFEFKDLDVPAYLAYLPVPLRVNIPSALLSGQLTLTFRLEKGKPSTLELSGRAALRDVRITDTGGAELLALPSLDVRIAAAELLTGRTSLESVLLQQPRLRVARDDAGIWNLAAFAPPSAGRTSTTAGKTATTFALDIAKLNVTDGTVLFSDATVKPPFAATLHAVELGVRSFSTSPNSAATVEASLATDAGETLRETGELAFSPLAAHGTVEVAGVPLRRYAAYYRGAVAFEVRDGVLGLSTGYAWSGSGDDWTLSNLAATLRSLRLHRAGERGDFLAIPETVLKGSAVDLRARNLALGELSLAGARLAVARGADGAWNLASLLPPSPAAPSPPVAGRPAAAPPPEAASPRWTVALKRLALARAAVDVDDALPARPVHLVLAPLALTAADLSTVAGVRGRVELRSGVNGLGTVSLAGGISFNPLAAKLAVNAKELPLVPLQGYVTDRLHLVVNDGAASAAGELTVAAGGPAPIVGFTGRAAIGRLATVDAHAAEDLVRWDSLAFDGVSFASEPFRLSIADVTLAGLASKVIVAADGTINLSRVLGVAPPPPASENEDEKERPAAASSPAPTPASIATPAPAAAAPEAGAADAVRIDKVTLSDGAIVFIDRSVSPEFRMDVTGLAGSVSGLSSLASTAADVDLHATINGQAPLSFTGKVNPLAGNLFLDIKVAARDLDLPPVSPYSGVYAGYTIQRGKLDLDLAYKVAQRRLEAQNKIELDQFDFGEKVASPKATHLPVRLAISLLKDRQGRITLNLPVSGSLDDPKFRVGRIILKMVVNLLVKVATSPFSLLGSLFGGSNAQLDTVAFAPGAATLDAPARASLDTLAKALNDRPGLRLEIAGRSDEVADREGLRRIGLERAIKREKLDDLVKRGGTAPSLDAVTVAPAEYDEYLTRAYKHGKFAKPRNFLGIAKKEPAPEMEKLLLASLDPTADALRHLAAARAEAVQGYLLQTGKVKADQLFIVAAIGASAASKEKRPATRVDLSLK
jgi:flagellar motor protein MotB